MRLTGERTAPGIWHENYWFRRHEAACGAVPDLVGSVPRIVLDAGSGEGYAAQILHAAWPGTRVVGVDYDPSAAAHAARTYGSGHAAYVRGAVTALPLASGVADVTVSLQVLEHIWTPQEYVRELARVTTGAIVLSTPNRLTFSPGIPRDAPPPSPYHVHEYDPPELRARLAEWLPEWELRLLGLHADHGTLVASITATAPEDWPDQVRDLVAAVTAADFELGDPDESCLDLVAVLTRHTGAS
jgi:SAM-dependent methyltransferase